MFLLVNYCIEIQGKYVGSSFLINKLKFRQNPQKLFILAKNVTFMSCSVFVTRLMMLLLYFKILINSQLLSKTTKSSYRLQGHEDRSVQFATCVKVCAYNNNIINLVTNTLHDMKVTVLAKINNF